MSRVLVIGCGGVASVAIKKCCQVSDVFTELCIASRTKSKCDKLASELADKTNTKISTAQVDADDINQLIKLINDYKPELVMNIALPYQDLTIMDACLACGVNYMDTANYEPEDTDDPEWRKIYEQRCREKGFSAGSGRTVKNLKRPDLPHYLAAALIPALPKLTVHTQKNMSLIQSIQLIFSTATAEITDTRLQQTLTPK